MTKVTQKPLEPENGSETSVQKRGQRVRYIREKLLRLSRAEFCKGFEWSPQSLKTWELGWGGGLGEERAKDLVKHLKTFDIYTTTPWLMHGIGMAPTALTSDLNISEEEEDHIAKELLVFREIKGAVDAIVGDDSMVPIFYPGDYVGGILTKNAISAINKQCIITDTAGNTYIRTLNKGDKENFYHLTCFNQNTSLMKEIKNAPIQTVAPIVWVRRRKPKG